MTDTTQILAIDDEPLNLALISDILELADGKYSVTSVDRGKKALELLEQQPEKFSLLLLDLMMPEMTGMELYQKIKKTPHLNGLIVIVQTARAGQNSLEEICHSGITYCITKPFLHDEFCHLIHSAETKIHLYRSLISQLKTAETLPISGSHLFKIKSKQDAFDTALQLASLTPPESAEKMVIVFWEAILNTLEHGLLKLGYNNKNRLLKNEQYDAAIEQGVNQLSEHESCYVVFSKTDNETRIVFTSQSSTPDVPFDYYEYKSMKIKRFLEPNGRGLATINQILTDLFPQHHCHYSKENNSLTIIF